jgi:hypothetical protein
MKKFKHNGFTVHLIRVTVGYKVESERFTRAGTSNNTIQKYGYEYKIYDCNSEYNTSKLLMDWKYILENLDKYKWVKDYLK